MASVKENNAFASEVFNTSYLLDTAIGWIKQNMDPEDVFDEEKLVEWASSNGFEPAGGEPS